MAHRLDARTPLIAAVVALSLLHDGRVHAQSLENPAAPPAAPGAADALPDPEPAADADDLDSLLDAADKDISHLGNVNVAANMEVSDVNPVVEGVSKKSETLAESPGIVDVITAKDIEQFGAKNLFEVLERATSVYMTGSYLFPRNMTSIRGNLIKHQDNHVLVLINGRPYRDITLGGINSALLTAFPIQTIERVEVIRGPGSVLYGTNAVTGVINVVTKDPDAPTFHVSTLNGSHGWQSYSLAGGAGSEHEAAYAGATYSRQEGWPLTATSEDPPGPAPAATQTAPWGEDNVGAFAMYRYRGFTANLFVADASQEMLGVLPVWPSERVFTPHVFLDLGYLLEIDDWQSLQTNFTYNYDYTHFPGATSTPANPVFARCTSNSWLVESTYRAELTDEFQFLLGGIADFHHGSNILGSLQQVPPFDDIWYGVYMQLEYQALEWLKLVGGMQAHMPGEIKSGIVPRFAAIASLSDHWTAKFLYGQAFRSPYRNERFVNAPGVLTGNPGLSPETIQTFDVQLAYHADNFRLAATAFHSDFFDIVTRVGAFPQTYINGSGMNYHGFELENDWELTEHWRTLSSVTYQDNVRDGVHNTTGVPNWMAKMGVAYHDEAGLNVGLFDSFFGDPTVPPTAAVVNPDPQAYHLVSLNTTVDLDRRFGWRSGRRVQAQFLIQNLFDEQIDHVEFERERINSLPAGPGRTYYGGVTVSY